MLPLLRLRWVLLNNPSCLRVTIYRLYIIVLYPPSGPWNAVESPAGINHEYLFFVADFFLSHSQRKEASRGGGGSLREQGKGTGTYGNSGHLFPNVPKRCSRTTFFLSFFLGFRRPNLITRLNTIRKNPLLKFTPETDLLFPC